MGATASTVRKRIVIDSELALEYTDATAEDIDDCYKTYVEEYGVTKMLLNQDEFDQVFSVVFNDTERHFNLFTATMKVAFEKDGDMANGDAASAFEVFSALHLLSKEELRGMDTKIAAIFKLFDLNKSGTLDPVELEILLSECIKGVSYATGTHVPLAVVPHELVEHLLKYWKKPLRGDVTLEQLKQWVSLPSDGDVKGPGIIEYLGQFTNARLIAREQLRVERALHVAVTQFEARAVAGAPGEPREMDVASLAALVRGLDGSPPTDREIQVFLEALDQNAGAIDGKVHLEEFKAAILPWISFSTIDEDHSASLNPDELKVLLWISDGVETKEPSANAIKKAIKEMDMDKNGKIDRLEWVMYSSGYDPATGAPNFNKSVHELWKKIDTDGTHLVTVDEIREAFVAELDAFVAGLERAGDGAGKQRQFKVESRAVLTKLVRETAGEVRDLMDSNSDRVIEWNEFKKHQRTIADKLNGVKRFAEELYNDAFDADDLSVGHITDGTQRGRLGVTKSKRYQ